MYMVHELSQDAMNAGYSPELDSGCGVGAGAGSSQMYGVGRRRRGVPRSGQRDGPAPLAVGQADGAWRSGGQPCEGRTAAMTTADL